MARPIIRFTNILYFYVLVTTLIALLIWDTFVGLATGQIIGFSLFPLTVQFVLLYLVLERHHYVPFGVRAWAGIFLILTSVVKAGATVLQEVVNNYQGLYSWGFGYTVFKILLGLGLILGTYFFIEEETLLISEKEE